MKTDSISVSVIIPIYNAEKYLTQCIESVLNQTLQNIEIILINDGSQDGSENICKEFLKRDSRIKYQYKENEGLAAARQDGINMASGDYVGFVDSDDWVELDMYEKMYLSATKNSADVVLCNCFEYSEKKNRTELRPGAYNESQILEEILPKTLIRIDEEGRRRNIRWSNCLRIYKKKTIDENKIQFQKELRRCQDLAFTYDVMLCSKNFYYLDEFLYHNRQDAGSLSRGYTKNMWKLIKPLIRHIYEATEKSGRLQNISLTHSTAFFLIIDCLLNEFKTDGPSLVAKKKNIKEIVTDEVCIKAVKELKFTKLNQYYKEVFYKNMVLQDENKLLLSYYYYHSSFKKKLIDPLLHILTETRVYKYVRHIRGKK